jgi:hypothetical protein
VGLDYHQDSSQVRVTDYAGEVLANRSAHEAAELTPAQDGGRAKIPAIRRRPGELRIACHAGPMAGGRASRSLMP